jgi:hypothetical protein
MAYGILLEFDDSVGKQQYDAVNEKLGIDMAKNGAGEWPGGLVSHAGGATADGFIVYEVWESKAQQEAFMAGRLGAALGAAGVPQPRKVTEVDVVGHGAR